jgi:hypothetical protein
MQEAQTYNTALGLRNAGGDDWALDFGGGVVDFGDTGKGQQMRARF